jgi:hypothetical protein
MVAPPLFYGVTRSYALGELPLKQSTTCNVYIEEGDYSITPKICHNSIKMTSHRGRGKLVISMYSVTLKCRFMTNENIAEPSIISETMILIIKI